LGIIGLDAFPEKYTVMRNKLLSYLESRSNNNRVYKYINDKMDTARGSIFRKTSIVFIPAELSRQIDTNNISESAAGRYLM